MAKKMVTAMSGSFDDWLENEPEEQDPVQQDPVQQDPVQQDPVQQDPVQQDPVQQDDNALPKDIKDRLESIAELPYKNSFPNCRRQNCKSRTLRIISAPRRVDHCVKGKVAEVSLSELQCSLCARTLEVMTNTHFP